MGIIISSCDIDLTISSLRLAKLIEQNILILKEDSFLTSSFLYLFYCNLRFTVKWNIKTALLPKIAGLGNS